MLAIRMQRTGRKGHAQFRVIVQDSHRSPNSGRVVARLGHYDPHSKDASVDKEKTAFYLEHGAQPSPRVISLLRAEKIKLPDWIEKAAKKKRAIRNPDKLRKNRPAEEKPAETAAPETTEEPAAEEEATEAATPDDAKAEASEETASAEEKPAEEASASEPDNAEAETAEAEAEPKS